MFTGSKFRVKGSGFAARPCWQGSKVFYGIMADDNQVPVNYIDFG